MHDEYKAYAYALREQVEQHNDSLNKLSEICTQRPLTFSEQCAAERNIQVLVEAAIGCSKHYLKLHKNPVPSESKMTIERVYALLAIIEPAKEAITAAVGMRNVIIHDYLNIDWKFIEPVIRDKDYLSVVHYVQLVTGRLLG